METPDFDQIAHAIARGRMAVPNPSTGVIHITIAGDALERAVAEQLRLVWNARGAADIARITNDLPSMLMAAGPFVKSLDRALRTLDR